MLMKSWLAGWRRLTTGLQGRKRRSVGRQVETLEPRYALAVD